MAKYVFEAETNAAGVNNVVPSYASFDEAFFYLQEATEQNYKELTFNLGLTELGVLESTGSTIVYEEGTEETEKKGNALVEFVKKALENFKGLVDNLLKSLQEKINQAKEKFNAKVLSTMKDRIAKGRLVKKGESIVFKKEFYEYAGIESALANGKQNVEHGVLDSMSSLKGNAVVADSEYVEKNIDTIVKIALDFQFSKKGILGPYNEIKKQYDEIIKAAKGNPNADVSEAKTKVTRANKNGAMIVKAFHARQAQYLGLLTAVAVKTLGKSDDEKAVAKAEKEAKKAEKAEEKKAPEATKESAVVAESYTTEVEKLFDWNF